VQERMTNQIAETIREKINPLGVAVVMEGTHLCMSMRGVEKQNSYAVTSAMLGAFRDTPGRGWSSSSSSWASTSASGGLTATTPSWPPAGRSRPSAT
jgi:hypothetical protein